MTTDTVLEIDNVAASVDATAVGLGDVGIGILFDWLDEVTASGDIPFLEDWAQEITQRMVDVALDNSDSLQELGDIADVVIPLKVYEVDGEVVFSSDFSQLSLEGQLPISKWLKALKKVDRFNRGKLGDTLDFLIRNIPDITVGGLGNETENSKQYFGEISTTIPDFLTNITDNITGENGIFDALSGDIEKISLNVARVVSTSDNGGAELGQTLSYNIEGDIEFLDSIAEIFGLSLSVANGIVTIAKNTKIISSDNQSLDGKRLSWISITISGEDQLQNSVTISENFFETITDVEFGFSVPAESTWNSQTDTSTWRFDSSLFQLGATRDANGVVRFNDIAVEARNEFETIAELFGFEDVSGSDVYFESQTDDGTITRTLVDGTFQILDANGVVQHSLAPDGQYSGSITSREADRLVSTTLVEIRGALSEVEVTQPLPGIVAPIEFKIDGIEIANDVKASIQDELDRMVAAYNAQTELDGLEDGDRLTSFIGSDGENLVFGVENRSGDKGYVVVDGERDQDGTFVTDRLVRRVTGDEQTLIIDDYNENGSVRTRMVGTTGIDENGNEIVVIKERINDPFTGIEDVPLQVIARLPSLLPDGSVDFSERSMTPADFGAQFGSTIGNIIAGDNPFERVAVNTALSVFGQTFGAGFVDAFFDGEATDFDDALESAFDSFNGEQLLETFRSAASGVASAYLTGELLGELNLDGVAGDVVGAIAQDAIGDVTDAAVTFLTGGEFNLNLSINPAEILASIVTSKVYGAVDSLLGVDTRGEQIGAQVGTLIGQFVPAIGPLVGRVVGILIGSLFGGTPRSAADVVWDASTGEFVVGNSWARKGGNKEAAENLAQTVAGSLNGIVGFVGGQLVNAADVTSGTYGMRKKDFTYRDEPSVGQGPSDIDARFSGEDGVADLINHGLFHALSDLKIAGGNIHLKRAMERLVETSSQIAFDINSFVGNLDFAQDYAAYLKNQAIIDAVIAFEPESAFSAGWLITIQRARELGAHKRAESDWYGGWDVALGVYDGPEGAEYTPGQLEFDLVGKERVTSLIDAEAGFVLGSYGDTIDTAGKDEIDVTGDLTISGDTIADTTGLTINGASPGAGTHQIDVAAVIRGDGQANVIRAGDLGNDVFGGGGDDVLRGGKLDDWLFGGDGADYIYAGDQAVENGADAGNGNYLDGGAGNDHLFGGTGSDWLEGGEGDDILKGGEGDDILSGGKDAPGGGGAGGGKALNFTGEFLLGIRDVFDGQSSVDGFTIAVTVRPNDTRGILFEYQRANQDGNHIKADVASNGELTLQVRGDSVTFGTNLVAGTKHELVITWDQTQGLARVFALDSQGVAVEIPALSNSEEHTTLNQLTPANSIETGGKFALGGQYKSNLTTLSGAGWAHYLGDYSALKIWNQSFLSGDTSAAAPLFDLALDADSGVVITDRANPGSPITLVDNQHSNFPATFDPNTVWVDDPDGASGGGTGSPGVGDILDGNAGNDQYLIRLGDGIDIIREGAAPAANTQAHLDRVLPIGPIWFVPTLSDWRGTSVHETADNVAAGGEDVLVLGPGIRWEDIGMKRAEGSDDLIITIQTDASDTADNTITLENWYGQRETRVEKLRLADGQEINLGYTNFFTGTSGTDLIIGTSGRDFVVAGPGNDFVSTLSDDDFANGGADNDVVDGGNDDDLVIGSTGDDFVSGGANDDAVQGGAGDDHVMGNNGHDVLYGGEGSDVVVGGAGNDVFHFGRGDGRDVIVDQLASSSWSVIYRGPNGDPSQNPPQGNYQREDLTIYDGAKIEENVVYRFGEVHEWIYWDLSGAGESALKQELVEQQGQVGGGQVYHYTGPELGAGLANGLETQNAGTDILEFDIGIDIADIHLEQRGDDLFLGIGSSDGSSVAFDALEDVVILSDWFVQGGRAIEEFLFFHTGKIQTSDFDLWGGGTDASQETITGGNSRDWLTGNAGDDTVLGEGGADILNGNGGQDTVNGGDGDDVLFGGAGNDVLIGGSGASDILLGGSGLDVASYEGSAGVTASLADSTSNTGDASGDEYDSIEGLIGSSGADTLIGNDFDNEITGGAGNDTLQGGLGDDAYLFRIGDDQDAIDDAGGDDDIISFDEGIALEDLSFSYSGASNQDLVIGYGADQITVDNFTVAGNQIETLQFADGLTAALDGLVISNGPASSNADLVVGDGSLSGGAGDDVVRGGDGADQLFGGEGNDILVGGSGGTAAPAGGGKAFNLTGDYLLSVPTVFSGQSSVDAFTVAFTVKPQDDRGIIFEYKRNDTNTARIKLEVLNSSHDMRLSIRGTSVDFDTNMVNGEERSFIVTWDSAQQLARMFEVDSNGQRSEVAAVNNNNSLIPTNTVEAGGRFVLGGNVLSQGTTLSSTNWTNYFGEYSELKIWNQAFLDGDVGGAAPLHDLALDTDSGTSVTDRSNPSSPLTLVDNAHGDFSAAPTQSIWVDRAGSGGGTGSPGVGDELNGGSEDLTSDPSGDWASYAGSDSPIFVDLAEDTSASSTATGGDAAGDWFTGIESVAGSAHNDEIAGDAENNVLKGYKGNDTLSGAGGDDVLLGEDGNDTLAGGPGEDNLSGGEGTDNLSGGADDDALFGDDGVDILQGDAGVDLLVGGDGDDQLSGGADDDTLMGDAGNDALSGGDGNDVITAGTGADIMSGGTGNDVYVATLDTGYTDTVSNAGGKDVLVLTGVAIADLEFTEIGSGSGADLKIRNTVGNGALTVEDWRVDGAELRYIDVSGQRISSFDLATLLASTSPATSDSHSVLWQSAALYVDNAVYEGNSGNDSNLTFNPGYAGGARFNGLAGNDTITGTPFDDIIDGGSGSDTLNGGAGDDTFVYDGDNGHDSVDGGDGIDRVLATADDTVIRIQSLSNVEEISAGGFSNVRFDGGSQANSVFDFSTLTVGGITDFTFGNNGQVVTGTAADDVIRAGAGNDEINGGDGNDILLGGNGNDTLDGGAGVDTADFSDGPSNRIIDLSNDNATGGEIDTLTSIENVIGTSGADIITGDAEANRLEGGAGDDDLHGGDGDDTLIGGAGVDAFFGGAGDDIVDYSYRDAALMLNVNAAASTGEGDSFDGIEQIIGTNEADDLRTDGIIWLRGGGGDDTLRGGAGDINVVVYEGHRDDYDFDSGMGVHTHVRNIDLRNDGTDQLIGINKIEYLGGGEPRQIGVSGNNPPIAVDGVLPNETVRETYFLEVVIAGGTFVDDSAAPLILTVVDVDNLGSLPDFIQTISGSRQDGWTFGVTPGVGDEGIYNLEIRASDGVAPQLAASTLQLTVLKKGEVEDGDVGPDTLTGGEGDDTLNGKGGDDLLIGLAGRDALNGGTGTDTADYSASPEAVQVNLASGTATGGHAEGDVLDSIENITGSDAVDTLIGDLEDNTLHGGDAGDLISGGSGADTLFGDGGDDVLSGDNGSDVLDGGAGVDTLNGEGGDDTLNADATYSGEAYNGGGGVDTLNFASYSRAINVRLDLITAEGHFIASIENVVATAFDDTLRGNSDANSLFGGLGDDTLLGSAGADTINGGAHNSGLGDTLSYESAGSSVEARLSGTGTLGIASGDVVTNVEHLTGSNFDDVLTGDDFENTLMGLAGDDIIYGEGSADKIYGNEGNDRLFGGAERDEIFGGSGNDYIAAGEGGDFLYGEEGNDFLAGNNAQDIYIMSRTSGHDVINNYDNDQAEDRVGYEGSIGQDNLWFERGTYDVGTVPLGTSRGDHAGALFKQENGALRSFTPDSTGKDVLVTILGEGSSVIVLDMLDDDGLPKRDYAINQILTEETILPVDVNITDLLVEMAGLTMPPGTSIAAAYPAVSYQSLHTALDNAWVGNSKPSIDLDASNPSNVANAAVTQMVGPDGNKSINVTVDENQVITLNLALDDAETPETLALEVTGYSDDVALLSGITANASSITIDPVHNASGFATFKATVYDAGLGAGASETIDINVTYTPIAQTPTLSVPGGSVAVNAGSSIDLDTFITAGLTDTDGSEELAIRLYNRGPFTISAGQETTDASVTHWRLTPSDLDDAALYVPSGQSASRTIEVVAVAADGTSTAQQTRLLTVDPNAAPTGILIDGASSGFSVAEAADGHAVEPVAVGRLTTQDADGDGAFVYEIVGGPDQLNFQIGLPGAAPSDPWVNTDILYRIGDIDRENAADLTQALRLKTTEIRSDGLVPLSYETDITVTLDDVPEAPQWTGTRAADKTVDENEDVDIDLTGATDPEGESVHYYFLLENGTASGNPDGQLSINPTTGKLSGQFDYEHVKNQSYFTSTGANSGTVEVRYLATDKAISGTAIDYRADGNYTTHTDVLRSTPQSLFITVENLSDERPDNPGAAIQDITQHVESHGNYQTPTGFKIATISHDGEDPDGDATELYIHSGPSGITSQFEMRGNELWIKQYSVLDYDNPAYGFSGDSTLLTFDIRARETHNQSEISSQGTSVTLELLSKNDNDPEISAPVGSLVVQESRALQPTSVQLTAIDLDIGIGGKPLIETNDNRVEAVLSSQQNIDPTTTSYDINLTEGFNWEALPDQGPGANRFANVYFHVDDGDEDATRTVSFEVVNDTEEHTVLVDLTDGYGSEPIQNEPLIGGGYFAVYVPQIGGYFPAPASVTIFGPSGVIGKAILGAGWQPVHGSTDPNYEWEGLVFQSRDEIFITPIIFDLDGDGVEMVALSSSPIWFDQNDDGSLDQTGWVGADDALLVLDRNGNGAIDGGSEISFVQDLPDATTDMEGLVAYDSNGDGVFDGGDSDYDRFQLWQDANQDGVSQVEELSSLEEAGIAAIDLALTPTGQTLENTPGNVMFNTAAFERTDGTTGTIGDVAFRFHPGEAPSAQHQQLENAIPASAVETDRQLQSLVQAMATFGADTGAAPLAINREDDANAANVLTATTRWASGVV